MSHIQTVPSGEVGSLLDDITTLIDRARQQVAVAVNAGLTALYWQVGQRIRKDLLLEEARAAYGEEIVATLSRQLTQIYGKRIQATLSQQLTDATIVKQSVSLLPWMMA